MAVQTRIRRSRLALWSRRAALLAVLAMLAAMIGHRVGAIESQLTRALLALSLTSAVYAVSAAIIAFGGIWKDGRRGFGAAMLGLVVGLALLGYPSVLFVRLFTLPAIADITTDFDDIPQFVAIDWPHPAVSDTELAAQRAAYPYIAPRIYAADAELVFGELFRLVEARGWTILFREPPVFAETELIDGVAPPGPGGGAVANPPGLALVTPGLIEAVARTPLLGFREDIAIRIATAATGTVVAIRSASRVFDHDFGSNARRIQDLFRDLDERLPGAHKGRDRLRGPPPLRQK